MANSRSTTHEATLDDAQAEQRLARDAQRVSHADAERVVGREGQVRALAKKGALRSALSDVVTLLAMVRDYVRGDYRQVPWPTITAAVAALLYVLNPFDLVPDALPLLGQLDDAAVIAACIKLVRKDITRYREQRRT